MDFSEIVKRFSDLESEGRELLRHFTPEELRDESLSIGWILAATNLLNLTFPNDGVFSPKFAKSRSFSSKVEILGSAGREFAKGFAANELRINFLRIAYADLTSEAQSLLDEGLVRCGAIVSRVALERHLRELGRAAATPDAETKKASLVNQELWKAGVYNKGVWSSVDSWLTIGNEAGHAPDFDEKYTPTQVQKAITQIASFIGSS